MNKVLKFFSTFVFFLGKRQERGWWGLDFNQKRGNAAFHQQIISSKKVRLRASLGRKRNWQMYCNRENMVRNQSRDDETSSPKHERRLTARTANPPGHPRLQHGRVRNTDAPWSSRRSYICQLSHPLVTHKPLFSFPRIPTTLNKHMPMRSGFIQE